jgi:hypothetical protein
MEAHIKKSGSVNLAIQEHFASARRNDERQRKYDLGLGEDEDLPPYVYQPYPRAMFAPGNQDSIVVKNAAEEKAKQKEGWFSTIGEALAVD